MTAVDGDGIDEDLTRTVSVAMLAAARAGEQFSRMTQAAAREREARAAGDTAQAQRQLAAHTESARAYFEVVARPEYLSVATDEQIREVARQAQAWRERLPEAERAADAASREIGPRNPEQVDEQAAVLAVEGEAVDRQARATDNAQREQPVQQEREGELAVRPEQPARQAVATAKVAQARSAREAPAATRGRTAGRGGRSSARPERQTGVER